MNGIPIQIWERAENEFIHNFTCAESYPDTAYVWLQQTTNIVRFLTEYKNLRIADHSFTTPEGPCYQFPLQDHNFNFSIKRYQEPIVLLTFPYKTTLSDKRIEEAYNFANDNFFNLEMAPPDIPVLWNPDDCIAMVWSNANEDWRKIAKAGK